MNGFSLQWKDVGRECCWSVHDFFFPPFCAVCKAPVSSGKEWFCTACHERFRSHAGSRKACGHCGQNRETTKCICHISREYPFSSVQALFDFDAMVKAVVHGFKYHGRKKLATHIATRYGHHIPPSFWKDVDLVTVIPLHFLRLMKRGYNQSAALARGFVSAAPESILLVPDIVRRRRHTRTQTRLTKMQRRKNLKNAFSIRPKYRDLIQGKRIVLVDDVVTTGSTTAICSEILLEAGAREVSVLCLARG